MHCFGCTLFAIPNIKGIAHTVTHDIICYIMIHPDFLPYSQAWDAKRHLADSDPIKLESMIAQAEQEWRDQLVGTIAVLKHFGPIEAPSYFDQYGDRRVLSKKQFTTGLVHLGELPEQTYEGHTHGFAQLRTNFHLREIVDTESQPRHLLSPLRGLKRVKVPRYELNDLATSYDTSWIILSTASVASAHNGNTYEVASASLPEQAPSVYDERGRADVAEYGKMLNIIEATLA